MEINFSNSTINKSQFGDNSEMNICEKEHLLSGQDWNELNKYFDERLSKIPKYSKKCKMVQDALKYVEEQDETGLKGYIKRNKEMFVTSILSNTASKVINYLLFNKLGI